MSNTVKLTLKDKAIVYFVASMALLSLAIIFVPLYTGYIDSAFANKLIWTDAIAIAGIFSYFAIKMNQAMKKQ
ncbi:TPA: hypothetical protein NH480_006398 [Pseudomonas aeruginosa]|uniref:hypothetical protein n=1 Tax=Pseudomonas aeruginosa TaxID=287 RepID=UPI0021E46C62|nr:hypothetical protein [Pseudomonas aeruginosa]UYF86591.1 hypothetical protein LLJ53_11300 [Pseudomonas aeruginosa]HCE9858423.1 hypothetical protein [Pseudomonas aeruginosa]